MENIKDVLNKIEAETKLLTKIDDTFGLDLGEKKGLFIQVVDNGEDMEYFIELNSIDSDGCYVPCADYNISSKFGDINELKKVVNNYLKDNIEFYR